MWFSNADLGMYERNMLPGRRRGRGAAQQRGVQLM